MALLIGMSAVSYAEESDVTSKKASSWLISPTFSSNPKIGTSAGLMGGYFYKFDPGSTSSMFGAAVNYSNTKSLLGGAFARMFFDGDTKRLNIFGGGGEINNEYKDFLGTGRTLSTTDSAKGIFARYLQQVYGHWYLGLQGLYGNYAISGDNLLTNLILEFIGLTGYDTAAMGFVGQYDDRNDQNAPSGGRSFLIQNFFHREFLGGEENFDVLNMEYKQFWGHGNGHVLAGRLMGRWTWDAPMSGYSSTNLRGYVPGQYLGRHSSAMEIEERFLISGRFGAKLFGGATCLYGNDKKLDDRDNWYPAMGFGPYYILNETEKIALSLEFAKGISNSNAVYIRFGQEF